MRSARFADVLESLLRAGVAPRHARRAVREMTDHFDDIVTELSERESQSDAEAQALVRLNPDALLEATIARPELHSWARRWPLASCTAFPLAVYSAFIVSSIALLVGCVTVFDRALGVKLASSPELQQFAAFSLSAIAWAMPVLAAGLFTSLMLARRMSAVWTVVGAAIISLIGATLNAGLVLPLNDRPGLQAGFGIGTDALAEPLFRAALTLALVLPIYFWRRSVALGRVARLPISRIAAIATAIGLHLAVVALLMSARTHRLEAYGDDAALTLIEIPRAAPRDVTPQRSLPSIDLPRVQVTPAPSLPRDTSSTPTTSPPASIDWSREGERAIARAVDALELERRRARGFTPEAQAREPETLLVPEPEFGWSKTAKRVEVLPEGGVLIRLSERCVLVVTGLLMPACALGEIPANGQLFEHMADPPVLGDWQDDSVRSH